MLSIFGTINNPIANTYGGLGDSGLSAFISNLLAFLGVVSGLIVFINFIIAGWQYMSAQGNAQIIGNAGNKMLQSLIGLIIIAAGFVIASLVGFIFFQDASFLLKPTFFSLNP